MLTDRFAQAVEYARQLHASQPRVSGVDMLSHLLAVASSVIEHGGNEDTAIAALLHDAAEDCGGESTLKQIAEKFGHRVSDLVKECSDSLEETKRNRRNWTERKRAFLRKMEHKSESALLIDAADKLHNARATYRDAKISNGAFWEKIKRTPEQQVAYFIVTHRLLSACYATQITSELGLEVSRLEVFCRDPVELRKYINDLSPNI